MTALCPGGGPSGPKPGTEPLITLSGTAIAGTLSLLGMPEIGLILGPAVSLLSIDTEITCATDPPADPGLTAQDLIDVTNWTDPTVSVPAILKAQQWFQSHYWYTICQCSSGTTPVAPPLSNPGPAGQDTGLAGGPSNQPCVVWPLASDGSLPGGRVFGGTSNLVDIFQAVNPPGGNQQTSVTIDGTNQTTPQWPGPVPGFTIRFRWAESHSGAEVTHSVVVPAGQSTLHISDTAPPGNYILPGTVDFIGDGSSNTFVAVWQLSMWCNGTNPNGFATPCCPPDPLLDNKLSAIYGMLVQLSAGSQGGPVLGLTDGAHHPNLSGAGSFVLVEQCPAIRVDVTPPLPSWPNNPGDPPYFFSMGFITSFAAGNPLRGWRLVYQNQVFPLASYVEQIGYTLPPGVVIDVVEQLPRGA